MPAAGDLFLFPTHYDPFSNSVLEAMSFENVVFTTRQNGASEILTKPFIMDDPQDFSIISTINRFLTDDDLLVKQKVVNSETARDYSIEKNVVKTLKWANIIK